MALEWSPVTPVAPIFPDAYRCDEYYGAQLNHQDCIQAAGYLPTGTSAVPYTIDPTGPLQPYKFPYRTSHGQCSVTVEIVGTYDVRGQVSIVPDLIRGLAEHVVSQCVALEGGKGGFATGGLANMIRYILSPQEHNSGESTPGLAFLRNLSPFPQTALYFTVAGVNEMWQGRVSREEAAPYRGGGPETQRIPQHSPRMI
ncbi:hypothetical protein MMC14_000761 [Varicellaria rhodocarpa]|nr:hypothetical protein [Varicellaria rhodocarpa]